MRAHVPLLLLLTLTAWAPASAEEWSRARIKRLPDSAFAVVEIAPDGTRVRHLPHHNEEGDVDIPHLRAALSRLGQVKWLDPSNEAVARRHLEEHRPAPPEVARVPAAVARLRSRIPFPP